jgi:hypothetical protein
VFSLYIWTKMRARDTTPWTPIDIRAMRAAPEWDRVSVVAAACAA